MALFKIIGIVSVFLVLGFNVEFFSNVLKVYPISIHNIGFLFSLCIVLASVIFIVLTLFSVKYVTKVLLMFVLIVSSLSAYFMDTYHIIIDDTMIQNMLQTDLSESIDLFSFKLILYLFFLGLLPSYLIYKVDIKYYSFFKELLIRLKYIAIAAILIVVSLSSFGKHYSSFFREHKSLRYSTNPTYWIYSSGEYIYNRFLKTKLHFKHIGLDAKIQKHKIPKLIIMVVGEALRADHMSLNGYTKDTNSFLSKDDVLNFSNFYSCATSTAQSVPCMFSIMGRKEYDYDKAQNMDNVLDILNHTNSVKILWRDNNSDSKGVALRVQYQNYKTPKNNTVCDSECRDEGMLIGLDKFVDSTSHKDILIILHQMGNHGPAYYKRSPQAYKKFQDECKTNQLEECSKEQIANAYDNAIVYTDYFLHKAISWLKQHSANYKCGLIYMSDHGESLGEGGVYLHGLPYWVAPQAQKHIASLMWFDDNLSKDVDVYALKHKLSSKYSHDNLFHTLLGLFNVQTQVYDKKLDILAK